MDVSGEHQLDVLHSIYKQRLSHEGEPINEKPEEIKLGEEHKDKGEENKEGEKKEEEKKDEEEKKEEEKRAVAKKDSDKCERSV